MALTVLSLGGGQDSVAILFMLARLPEFCDQYAGRDDLLTLMSDTGNEHDETYDYLRDYVPSICAEARSEWVLITRDMGFHSEKWPSLQGFFELNNAIGSKAYPKSCTDQLKLRPIYRFLEDYLGRKYGLPTGRKRAFYAYREQFGKLRVLLGITAEEAGRRLGDRSKEPKWARECVDKVYPLVDRGMTRHDCQKLIAGYGKPVPLPSNCEMCPFVSHAELLWLYTFRRASYDRWVQLEANKLERDKDKGEKNFGVFGRMTLPQALEEARKKYGHWTREQLWEFKMTHGHGVCSKY